MMHTNRWVAAGVLAASIGLAGCGSTVASAPTTSAPPVQLRAAAGSDLKIVTLNAQAVTRLAIATAVVRRAPLPPHHLRRAAAATVIPYSAVVYDERGATWTFVTTAPRSYVRRSITVDHIDGESAYLSAGPAVGTKVVTTGSEELLGAEYEISGE